MCDTPEVHKDPNVIPARRRNSRISVSEHKSISDIADRAVAMRIIVPSARGRLIYRIEQVHKETRMDLVAWLGASEGAFRDALQTLFDFGNADGTMVNGIVAPFALMAPAAAPSLEEKYAAELQAMYDRKGGVSDFSKARIDKIGDATILHVTTPHGYQPILIHQSEYLAATIGNARAQGVKIPKKRSSAVVAR